MTSCLVVLVFQLNTSNALSASTNVRTVHQRNDVIDRNDFPSLKDAVHYAREDTAIYLGEGSHVIDNPIVLNKARLRIVGEGWNKTAIYPRNVGQAIFKIAAAGVIIEDVTVDAKVKDTMGRATFAIHIQDNYGGCAISRTRILNTGASSIIGRGIAGCVIEHNAIGNAGDDAIQLRGDNLIIVGNAIAGYFDEAIDVASGKSIVITDNHISNGRIGLVVDDAAGVVVHGNIVEDQAQEGIVVASKNDATITNNTVRASGTLAFNLFSPLLVKANRVEGRHKIAVLLSNAGNAVIQGNVVDGAETGFEIRGERPILISANKYEGMPRQAMVIDSESRGKKAKEERLTADASYQIGFSSSWQAGAEVTGHWTREKLALAQTALSTDQYYVISGTPKVTGDSERGIQIARQIAEMLERNNPGFLSVRVEGSTMRSEITEDLYATLTGSGQLGAGLVRAPYLAFKGTAGSFPSWYLSFRGNDVAMVSATRGGSGVRITLIGDGMISIWRSLYVWIDRAELFTFRVVDKVRKILRDLSSLLVKSNRP